MNPNTMIAGQSRSGGSLKSPRSASTARQMDAMLKRSSTSSPGVNTCRP